MSQSEKHRRLGAGGSDPSDYAVEVSARPLWVRCAHTLLRDCPHPFSSETWEEVRSHLGLSPREFEIALCISAGMGRKQAAKVLAIRPATVASHLERIFRKLEIHSQRALVAAMFRAFLDLKSREGE